MSEQRIAFTPSGNIRYELKIPYRDGTTHVIFEPLDFIARLAALVPPLRINLTRYHGVFAPSSHERAAELLGIKPTTLSSRIKKYQIDAKQYKKIIDVHYI